MCRDAVENIGTRFATDGLGVISDEFHQASQTNEGHERDLVCGLHITRGLLKSNGGTIRVKGELGRGSQFTSQLSV